MVVSTSIDDAVVVANLAWAVVGPMGRVGGKKGTGKKSTGKKNTVIKLPVKKVHKMVWIGKKGIDMYF